MATFSVSLSFSPETQSNQKKKKQILERMANERKTRKNIPNQIEATEQKANEIINWELAMSKRKR